MDGAMTTPPDADLSARAAVLRDLRAKRDEVITWDAKIRIQGEIDRLQRVYDDAVRQQYREDAA